MIKDFLINLQKISSFYGKICLRFAAVDLDTVARKYIAWEKKEPFRAT